MSKTRLAAAVTLLACSTPLAAQSFDPLVTAFGEMREARVLQPGDFDHDGDVDVVLQVALGIDSRWELHRNDGEGALIPETITLTGPATSARAIAAGDFDGDGFLDFVASDLQPFGPSSVRIFFNSGTAAFQEVPIPIAISAATALLPLDFDGDNDLDLVVATGNNTFSTPNPSQLLQNDGSGGFTDVTAALMPNPAAVSLGIAALDLQGDGRVDIVLDGYPPLAMLGNAAGGFTAAPGFFTSGITAIRAVDFDGDGDLDVVGVNLNAGNLKVFRNDGGGSFATLLHPVPGIGGWLSADVDGDGDEDFLTVAAPGNEIRLWRHDPGFVLVDVTATRLPPLSGSIHAGAFLDSDGDGDRDLYVPRASVLLHNDGTGAFSRLGKGAALELARAPAMTDVDGDGYMDLVALDAPLLPTSPTAADLTWWRNDGTGEFERATALANVAVCNASRVVTFDMDGDGDEDVWSLTCGTDRVFRNDGGGIFTEVTATAFPVDTRSDGVALVRDFDGDGRLDVFMPRDYLFDSYYHNLGGLTFADEGNTRLNDNELTRSAAALDYDGDGDLDLALANDPTPLRLFRNDGTGNFTDDSAGRLPPLPHPHSHVIAFDMDGDHDDDLLLTSASSALLPSFLLRNDGGVFTDVSGQLPSPFVVTTGYWPQAVDFDLDGDLDLLHGRDWLINDGNGTFSVSPIHTPMPASTITRTRAFADLDGDGDPDVVHGRVARNLHRQLENALPPRLGLHGEVRVHARPAQPGFSPLGAVFFSDVLAAPTSLGAFGAIHVNPNALALLGTWIVPASPGYARARYLVPNDTGLLGVAIPLQALVVNGPSQIHTTSAILLAIEQ